MRYKGYKLEKSDRNWVLTKTVTGIRDRDLNKGGKTLYKKGEPYHTDQFIGYYGDIAAACRGLVKDADFDCEDLLEFAARYEELCRDIVETVRELTK